jgi:hypothetical protein
VPFAYYDRLSARSKRTYRASDAIRAIELPEADSFRPLVAELEAALLAEDRRRIQRLAAALADGLCERLGAPPVRLRVLAARPTGDYGELHGLYEPEPPPARITVWMRTAARRKVVAFRSFLRTILHELLHHFDYELFELEETFHTEGFFQRESSLARQLLGLPEPAGGPPRSPSRSA